MCGIVGVYNLVQGDSDLVHMCDALAHRGPDATGYYRRSSGTVNVALGHRRLSIIDLTEDSNQPFEKNGFALVFNGEIYNYQALRDELRAHGVSFRTQSDTEVLLEAWRRWGAGALPRLRGMFAFALYDERTGSLALARDQFGIKPLFWTARAGGIAFASELKALRPIVGTPQVDPSAVIASLLYYWIPDEHCVWSRVEKLRPGTWLEVTQDGHVVHEWWDPVDELVDRPEDVGIADLRAIVEDSVAAHMVADVPVATFLSGGLDSSLISVLAKRHNPDLRAYTISFRAEDQRFEAMPDDLTYARRVAEQFGITLHEVEVAPDVTDLLPRMVRALDEPIGDAAAINAYLICDAARQIGTKVLLSGMGADELFGGYRKHYANLLASRYRRLPAAVRERMVSPLVDQLPVATSRRGYRTVRWAKRFLEFADLPEEAAFRQSYTHYSPPQLRRMLDPSLWSVVDDLVHEHAAVYAQGPDDDHVNRMCYTDTRMFLPGLNLAYTDRASMAASTEVRVPFVDREVVRAAFAIDGGRKIAGTSRKDVLKEAALAWLPREITHRPKGLFSAPLRAWIRRDLSDMIEDKVANGALVDSGLLDRAAIRSLIDEDRDGRADRSKQIWQLLTLEVWFEQSAGARGVVHT